MEVLCVHTNGSCQDINVYCPPHDDVKRCAMSSYGGDIHRSLDFFCVYGFEDLDISEYNAKLIGNKYDPGTSNMMHCGEHYKDVCKLNDALSCECGDHRGSYQELTKDTEENHADVRTGITVLVILLFSVQLALLLMLLNLEASTTTRN
eukprot:7828_1